jgi:hypothetical protein
MFFINRRDIGPLTQSRAAMARMSFRDVDGKRSNPADFGKLITEETEKWGKVVKFPGIKAE